MASSPKIAAITVVVCAIMLQVLSSSPFQAAALTLCFQCDQICSSSTDGCTSSFCTGACGNTTSPNCLSCKQAYYNKCKNACVTSCQHNCISGCQQCDQMCSSSTDGCTSSFCTGACGKPTCPNCLSCKKAYYSKCKNGCVTSCQHNCINGCQCDQMCSSSTDSCTSRFCTGACGNPTSPNCLSCKKAYYNKCKNGCVTSCQHNCIINGCQCDQMCSSSTDGCTSSFCTGACGNPTSPNCLSCKQAYYNKSKNACVTSCQHNCING